MNTYVTFSELMTFIIMLTSVISPMLPTVLFLAIRTTNINSLGKQITDYAFPEVAVIFIPKLYGEQTKLITDMTVMPAMLFIFKV